MNVDELDEDRLLLAFAIVCGSRAASKRRSTVRRIAAAYRSLGAPPASASPDPVSPAAVQTMRRTGDVRAAQRGG